MIHYTLLFLFPALIAILQPIRKPSKSLFLWIPTAILFILFMGFRDEVGGDWGNYLEKFDLEAYGMSYMEAFLHGDPAYWVTMVLAHSNNWGIYGVNLIGSIISMTGLIIFLRRMPNPWLSLTIAVAYTILVVMMGYVRQGIALGIVFWAIVALSDRKFLYFVILILFASAFHKTAIIMLGLGIFQQGKGKFIKALAAMVFAVGIGISLLSGSQERLAQVYIDSGMQSSGAYIRIFMNLIPSLIFLWFRKTWQRQYSDYTFWHMMALGSIVALFLVGFASTAVDRIALYFIPIQIVVFSRLPLLIQHIISPKTTTMLIIIYYGLVYFVWLNFAANAYAWLPYDNLILQFFFQ